MRTVYLGTSPFAAAVLRRLADTPHRPLLVVTRPDAPKGRGRKLAPPPVAETAHELGLDLLQPENANDATAVAAIARYEPDVVLLCAFGALIREPLLSRFGPILNVHPSLLPRWRGAAPVERAIMAGDDETGVSIMALQEGFDDGPVYLAAAEPIHAGDTYGTLAPRLEQLGADLLVRTMDDAPEPAPQPEDGVTYADKVTAADRTLDPARPAVELERVVRALTPHIGARAEWRDVLLGVRRARAAAEPSPLCIETAEGWLQLLEVQPPGGRPMDAEAFLRGRGA